MIAVANRKHIMNIRKKRLFNTLYISFFVILPCPCFEFSRLMVYILPLIAIDVFPETPMMLIGFINLFSPLGFFIGIIVAQVNIKSTY